MASSIKLIISPLARDDLRDIYQYGCLHWGKPRSQRYMEHIKEQFENLTEHPQLGILREDLVDEIRSLTIDSHIIYYRNKSKKIEIVRVLHGRQDPQRHL